MTLIFIIRILSCAILYRSSTDAFYLRPAETDDGRMKVDATEKCYYHLPSLTDATVGGARQKTIFYGQCMSMVGPDGCCLEGHYQPGLCSNLAHLCCTKPDPDCQNMRNNKGITKSNAKKVFREFVANSRPPRSSTTIPSTRPITATRRYQTNFEIIEMPAHMQLDPVSFVAYALDRYHGDYDDAADYLCTMLDRKYPSDTTASWACYIGEKFGFSVDPEPGRYMLFKIGHNDLGVMAFIPKTTTKKTTTTTT